MVSKILTVAAMTDDDRLIAQLRQLEDRLADAGEARAANLCFAAHQRIASLLATVQRTELERVGQGSLSL